MSEQSLRDLYAEHKGKVSDKWAICLETYDRIFSALRDQSINLLEIGIQNGGSLEIWAKYFARGSRILGCDINTECAQLEFSDPGIRLVIGDANADETQSRICAGMSQFDIIIDDGSHRSMDIIRSFFRYFPLLKTGGIYVAEDLHCSYWKDHGGGIFNPLSAIEVFKLLIDATNHEHWGLSRSRFAYLNHVMSKYDCSMDEEELACVHSVEFVNSMCLIRKDTPQRNVLGNRIHAGEIAAIVPNLDGLELDIPSQEGTFWSSLEKPPAAELVTARDLLRMRNTQLESMSASRSWRYTAPLRWITRRLKGN